MVKMAQSEKKVVTISANRRMIVYTLDGLKVTKLWQADKIHLKDVTDVIWNYDETKIITCAKDKSIKIWSYEDGRVINHIEDAHNDLAMALCRFEGTKDFYSGGLDGHITCWDNAGNKVRISFTTEIHHKLAKDSILSMLWRRQVPLWCFRDEEYYHHQHRDERGSWTTVRK